MQKALKRTLSLLLVVLMAFGSAAAAFARESAADAAHCQTDYTVSGANALGTILADALDGAEADPNEPYLIRDVSVQGSSVTVVFQNEAACDVVAAAYDESTMRMLCSAVQAVDAHAGEATLTLADLTADSIVIKAFLLGEKHQALCKSYTFLDLTTAYKEFFAKDTDDFDADKVVNLDADKESNFLVLSDDAHRAAPNGTKDKLLTADYDRNVYTFGNATAALTGLKSGDLFYYNDAGMENVVILRVSSVTVAPDGTATVTGEPVGMEEAFSFVHIDTTTDGCDFEADTSDMDAGVTLLDDENGGAKKAPHKAGDIDLQTDPWIKRVKLDDGPLHGFLRFSLVADFNVRFAKILGVDEASLVLNMNLSAELTISGSLTISKKIAQFRTMPVPGVEIGIKPTFIFKMSAKCKTSASVDFRLGVGYCNGAFINKSGFIPPTFTGVELDGKASIGIDMKPYACLIGEKALKLELSGEVDLEIEGKMGFFQPEADDRVKHGCGDKCVDGDLTILCALGAKLVVGEGTFLEQKLEGTLPPFRWHVGDFYWSLAYMEFGWGTCPHRLVRVDFWVKKKDTASGIAGAVIHTGVTEEAAIEYNNESADVTTDTGGWATYYFPIADVAYIPKVTASGYEEIHTEEIHVYYDKADKAYLVNGTDRQVTIEVELEEAELIEFGSYPQSEVKDLELIAALNEQPHEWISYGYYSGTGEMDDGNMTPKDYMQYCDVVLDGQKYRGVYFSQYRPCLTDEMCPPAELSDQYHHGYSVGPTYWFHYEPLKWNICDSGTGLVLCDSIIDSQPFNNYTLHVIYYEYFQDPPLADTCEKLFGDPQRTYLANNYARSSIRQWLNSTFYNTAFSLDEQTLIVATKLEGQASADNVFLLSNAEACNTDYFHSASLRAIGTDYAECQGLMYWIKYEGVYSTWRLRSSCIEIHYNIQGHEYWKEFETGYVYGDGSIGFGYGVGNAGTGIRPAMRLDLEALLSPTEEKTTVTQLSTTRQKTAVTTQTSNAFTLQAGQICTAAASGTVAGNEYVLLARTAGAAALTSDNTLYIDQQTASGSTVSFTYVPRTGGEALVEIIGDFGSGIETRTVTSSDTPAGKLHAVTANDLTLIYKKDGKIEPVVTADSGAAYTLTFTSSNPKVAAVDENGHVKTLKKGTAEITVTAADASGNTAECTCRVTVKYAWWQWLIRILLLGFIWY